MNSLVIREVDFRGAPLMAAQDKETGKIYVGVSWLCRGIGFTKGEKDRQVKNVQTNIVLKQGCAKFDAGVFDPNNETLAIELEFLPLWLAKISLTPQMQAEQPEVAERLVDYQLKAKDVLAEAFLPQITKRKKPIDTILRQQFNMAKTITDHLGVKPGIAYALAVAEAERISGESLASYKRLLPAADHEIGLLNATELGKLIGIGPREMNQLLQNLGFQYRDEKKRWRITHEGKSYGEEFPFSRNGHSDYQIRWNESIVGVINENKVLLEFCKTS